jgi:hypothetical protein
MHIPGNKNQDDKYNTLISLHKRLKEELLDIDDSTRLGFDFNNNDLNFSEFVTQHFIELTNDLGDHIDDKQNIIDTFNKLMNEINERESNTKYIIINNIFLFFNII